jgi:hypothetical protein
MHNIYTLSSRERYEQVAVIIEAHTCTKGQCSLALVVGDGIQRLFYKNDFDDRSSAGPREGLIVAICFPPRDT